MESAILIQRGKSLKTQVYEALKTSLLSGTWTNERLSEATLAMRLGVSRTPVREALFELRREGLLNYAGRGTIGLPRLRPEDVCHAYQLRHLLEDFACQQVGKRLTVRQAKPLRDALRRMQQAARRNAGNDLLRADRDYHVALAALSGNPMLAEYVGMLFDRTVVAGIETTLAPARRRKVLVEHAGIVDALKQGEVRRARQILEAHVKTSSDLLVAAVKIKT